MECFNRNCKAPGTEMVRYWLNYEYNLHVTVWCCQGHVDAVFIELKTLHESTERITERVNKK